MHTGSSINIPHKKGILHLLAINGRAAALSSSSTPAPNQQLVNLQMNTSPRSVPSAHVAPRDFQSNDTPSFCSSLILLHSYSLFVSLAVSQSSESDDGGMVFDCNFLQFFCFSFINKRKYSSLISNLFTSMLFRSTHSLTNRKQVHKQTSH